MSKSKFKIAKGLALVQITGEPVFVKKLVERENPFTHEPEEVAEVVRAIVTSEGIVYRTDAFPTEELETRIAQAKRDIEFKVAANELVAAAEDKQYDLSKAQRKALETVADNPRVIMEGVRA